MAVATEERPLAKATFRVDEELLHEAQVKAKRERTTIQAVAAPAVEAALRSYLTKKVRKSA